MIKDILVFALSSNVELTDRVCSLIGIERSKSIVKNFADGECLATPDITCDVRGKKVYIIQSTCKPVNDRIMETLILLMLLEERIVEKLLSLFLISDMLDKIELLI